MWWEGVNWKSKALLNSRIELISQKKNYLKCGYKSSIHTLIRNELYLLSGYRWFICAPFDVSNKNLVIWKNWQVVSFTTQYQSSIRCYWRMFISKETINRLTNAAREWSFGLNQIILSIIQICYEQIWIYIMSNCCAMVIRIYV